MSLAYLCSGQGRQHPEMIDIFRGSSAAESIIEAAGALLGSDPRGFIRHASPRELYANRASQVLCVTAALAGGVCLPANPLVVTGYSIGEFAAWGVAGVWTPEATLRLAAYRAELMDDVDRNGALGFIKGLTKPEACKLVSGFECHIAIVNPGDLYVIGGASDAVRACCSAASKSGATSRLLDVYIASHTPRLSAVVRPLLAAIRREISSDPAPGVSLFNVSTRALVSLPATDISHLAEQAAAPIDWATALERLISLGVTHVLELGPGDALSGMLRTYIPRVEARALQDFDSLTAARSWVQSSGVS